MSKTKNRLIVASAGLFLLSGVALNVWQEFSKPERNSNDFSLEEGFCSYDFDQSLAYFWKEVAGELKAIKMINPRPTGKGLNYQGDVAAPIFDLDDTISNAWEKITVYPNGKSGDGKPSCTLSGPSGEETYPANRMYLPKTRQGVFLEA